MTTIEEYIKDRLTKYGMFDEMAAEVVDLVKADKDLDSMRERWHEPVDAYPPMFMHALWLSVNRVAREYLDEKLPKAWFRPMFD